MQKVLEQWFALQEWIFFFHFVKRTNWINHTLLKPMFDNDQLIKIRMIIEHFNKTKLELITPEKNLSIDESMMLWYGRLIFQQYIKNMQSSFMSFVPTMHWYCQQWYMVVKVSVMVKLQPSHWSWWSSIWRKDTTYSLITITIQFLWRNFCPQKKLTLQALSERTGKEPPKYKWI